MSRLEQTLDFAVVGAGIAGASIAYELSRECSVALLEAEDRPGLHATGRSAALYAPSYGGREMRALTRASRGFFLTPPTGFTESALLSPRGCLYIARSDQHERLTDLVDGIRSSGGTVLDLHSRVAFERVPLLRREYVVEVAADPDAMDIDVNRVHQGFMRGARTNGTLVVTSHRLGRVSREKGRWAIQLDDGRVIRAAVLINAAGAWADEVAQACGARPIGLQPLRRTALLVEPPAGMDIGAWPAVIDCEELFYFKPDAGKLLLSPADETPTAPGDAQPDDLDVALAVDRVEKALDIEIRRVTHSWAGLRTFAPDRAPVCGYDPHVSGFFWCAGQGGYGIQSAPAMARTAASLVRREPLPKDIAAEGLRAGDLSPERFLP